MIFCPRHSRTCSWIAIFAIFFSTFAPGIGAAISANRGEYITAELCTSEGLKFVQVDVADGIDKSQPGKNILHGDHCPFCISHVSTFIPPYDGSNVFLFELVPQLLPQFPEQPIAPRFVGASWQARGPPMPA